MRGICRSQADSANNVEFTLHADQTSSQDAGELLITSVSSPAFCSEMRSAGDKTSSIRH